MHHIIPILKSLHCLNIPAERIHSKSPATNLQLVLPAHLPSRIFTIKKPALPGHLLPQSFSTPSHYSSQVFQPNMSITAPRLWNYLPPELHTFSVPPPSLSISNHHLHPTSLSITRRALHSKLICVTSYIHNLTHPILRIPTIALNDTRLKQRLLCLL